MNVSEIKYTHEFIGQVLANVVEMAAVFNRRLSIAAGVSETSFTDLGKRQIRFGFLDLEKFIKPLALPKPVRRILHVFLYEYYKQNATEPTMLRSYYGFTDNFPAGVVNKESYILEKLRANKAQGDDVIDFITPRFLRGRVGLPEETLPYVENAEGLYNAAIGKYLQLIIDKDPFLAAQFKIRAIFFASENRSDAKSYALSNSFITRKCVVSLLQEAGVNEWLRDIFAKKDAKTEFPKEFYTSNSVKLGHRIVYGPEVGFGWKEGHKTSDNTYIKRFLSYYDVLPEDAKDDSKEFARAKQLFTENKIDETIIDSMSGQKMANLTVAQKASLSGAAEKLLKVVGVEQKKEPELYALELKRLQTVIPKLVGSSQGDELGDGSKKKR